MTKKVLIDLKSELAANINDNNSGDITAAELRQVLEDTMDSFVHVDDAVASFQPMASAAVTPPQAGDGEEGDIMYDDTKIYIKTATGWKSATLT